MRNGLVVDFWLSHWRLAAALKASRCSDVWNGVDVRSAVASAHCTGRSGSLLRGDPLPRRGSSPRRGPSLHWRLPRWRGCRLCRRLGRGSSCGVTSQNSPRAGRQQGYAGSGGCVGSPFHFLRLPFSFLFGAALGCEKLWERSAETGLSAIGSNEDANYERKRK